MKRVEVWAPRAERVAVQIGEDDALPLQREDGDWWRLPERELKPGERYAFVVDESKPLPDPRSLRQPEGVHGPSEVVDHGAFSWTDAGFRAPPLSAALIYELHVGTFSEAGTFDGVVDRLDHLVDLGVTHVELMPVNGFSGTQGWGYDGVNWFAPHEPYGGPEGLKRLVDACHGRGLAVILDVVYNHLGPEGNYTDFFGPYFTERYKTPWGKSVNLDEAGSHEVRRFIVDSATAWLRDYHADGLRIDAVETLFDQSATHILEELATAVEHLEGEVRRPLALIAESDLNNPRVVSPREAGGYGIDAQWSDDFHHALHTSLTGEQKGYYVDFGGLDDVATALSKAWIYAGRYSAHRDRGHGKPPRGLSGNRFLGYSQTHDQVGNRATGERLCHLVSTERAKVAAALVFTAPFVPMLFQGEEWAASSPFQYFTNHTDPGLGEAVREGRRREFAAFGWDPEEVPDPQAEETFHRSQLDWGERERSPHAEVLKLYRDLAVLRRRLPSLTDGELERVEVRSSSAEGWLSFARGPVRVAVNLSPEERAVPLVGEGPDSRLLGAETEVSSGAVRLPPEGFVILGPPTTHDAGGG